jgi:hypothetical protein
MAKVTTYSKGAAGAIPWNELGAAFAFGFTLDFDATGASSGDILELLKVPARTLIESAVAQVKTAEGATLTFDLGDYLTADDTAVDADGYLDGVNGNSAAVSKSSTITLTEGTPNTIGPGYYGGKYYPTANSWIGLLLNNDAATAVIEVFITGKRLANAV